MSTERRNPRSVDIDLFPTERILKIINTEDALVANVVAVAVPQIAKVVDLGVEAIRSGGRILYVGAGTSGRIGALDAAECPTTFSAPPDWVEAVIAGGSKALVQGLEGAEDDLDKAAADLKSRKVSSKDLVVGIAASGKTPYTIAALDYSKSKNARTAAIVAAPDSPMAKVADVVIETLVGPEIVTGSTRMKAGTAQKMVLNMLSSGAMTRLGYVYGNLMVHVTPRNSKLAARSVSILQQAAGVGAEVAAKALQVAGNSVPVALVMLQAEVDRREAERALKAAGGHVRRAIAAARSL